MRSEHRWRRGTLTVCPFGALLELLLSAACDASERRTPAKSVQSLSPNPARHNQTKARKSAAQIRPVEAPQRLDDSISCTTGFLMLKNSPHDSTATASKIATHTCSHTHIYLHPEVATPTRWMEWPVILQEIYDILLSASCTHVKIKVDTYSVWPHTYYILTCSQTHRCINQV